MAETQKQSSGDGSVNIQADKIVLGASFGEIREIAQTIFDANFYKLAQVAADVAKQRTQEFTESFLQQLAKRKPIAAGSANDPDFQYGLFTAQKEYARSGDKDLGNMLVDILVDRAAESDKSLKQLVLNEALSTVPKLIPMQWNALTIIFLVKYIRFNSNTDLGWFLHNIERCYTPFMEHLPQSNVYYQHLVYAGCGDVGTFGINQVGIEQAWKRMYPYLFFKGFDDEKIKNIFEAGFDTRPLVRKSPRDSTKLEFNMPDVNDLIARLNKLGVSDEKTKQAVSLYSSNIMSESEVKKDVLPRHPIMPKLFAAWDRSSMGTFTLTSIGTAIAHANLRRLVKGISDLEMWIK